MSVTVRNRVIRFRVTDEADARLRAAASLVNESLTDFTLRPALDRADKVLAQADVTMLPAEQYDRLLAALDEPVTPIEELGRIALAPRRFTRA
jgi:uncharacterized protein (DUF1778 family)